MESQIKWYQKSISIIALLILFFPAGLFLMWKYAGWNKWIKIVITSLFAFIFISSQFSSIKNGSSVSPQPTSTAVLQTKNIDYEVTRTWEIPNGGFGKTIFISPQNFNEADMTLLGKQLKEDLKNDRNSFIFIFDDKKAAIMRDTVLSDKLSSQDQDYYDKHYVGEYTKNGNSGYHQLTIYLDGIMGSNQKTIKY